MKILQIGKFFPPEDGGIEQVTFNLSEGLSAQGIQSDVLCFTRKESSTETRNGYSVFRHHGQIEFLSTPASIPFMCDFKQKIASYDILHLHCPNPWPTFQLLLSRPKIPTVVHWHGDIVRYGLLATGYRQIENNLLKYASSIIATSQKYAEASLLLQPFLEKTSIVPIGIDHESLTPDASVVNTIQHRYGRKKIVFSLGRLIYYKGFDVLVRAAAHLPDDHIVLIGGTGPLQAELNHQIQELGLADKVKLLGKVPTEELASYYSACTLFCLPSVERSEAFGVVLLEAMALGKPIVASAIPGSAVDWVNQDGITGLNVTPRSPLKLAAAIQKITGDPSLAKQYSQGSRDRMNTLFTRKKMVGDVIRIYQNILK